MRIKDLKSKMNIFYDENYYIISNIGTAKFLSLHHRYIITICNITHGSKLICCLDYDLSFIDGNIPIIKKEN